MPCSDPSTTWVSDEVCTAFNPDAWPTSVPRIRLPAPKRNLDVVDAIADQARVENAIVQDGQAERYMPVW